MSKFMTRSIAGCLALAAVLSLSPLNACAGVLGQPHLGMTSDGTTSAAGNPSGSGTVRTTPSNPGGSTSRGPNTPAFIPPAGRELHKMVATLEFCILRADGQRMWFRRPYTTSYYDAKSKQWIKQDWKSQVEYAISSLHTAGHVVVSVTPISHTHTVVFN